MMKGRQLDSDGLSSSSVYFAYDSVLMAQLSSFSLTMTFYLREHPHF